MRCEGALHAYIGEVNDYCAVFGLSLRSYNSSHNSNNCYICIGLSAARIYQQARAYNFATRILTQVCQKSGFHSSEG